MGCGVCANGKDVGIGILTSDSQGRIAATTTQTGGWSLTKQHSIICASIPEDDAVVGLHLFARQKLQLTSRSCTLLTCTTKGNASMRSIEVTNSPAGSASIGSSSTWNACGSGNILCSKVDGSEPPKPSLDLFTPNWFTSLTFLSKDDHRKIVAGTNSHQVVLEADRIAGFRVLEFFSVEILSDFISQERRPVFYKLLIMSH
ncbi:hypothetical protein SO802_006384 [Lithocarpus litseifolius]|uniref:Uncharacterized protein n=1 Tax=Lithocarpus litseifolius TaxID=425828 RepID=A0AAW2DLI2_9ROSI